MWFAFWALADYILMSLGYLLFWIPFMSIVRRAVRTIAGTAGEHVGPPTALLIIPVPVGAGLILGFQMSAVHSIDVLAMLAGIAAAILFVAMWICRVVVFFMAVDAVNGLWRALQTQTADGNAADRASCADDEDTGGKLCKDGPVLAAATPHSAAAESAERNSLSAGGGRHSTRKRFDAVAGICVAVFVGMFTFYVLCLSVIPRSEKIFRDFDTNLGLGTKYVIRLSLWIRGDLYPTAVFATVMSALCGALLWRIISAPTDTPLQSSRRIALAAIKWGVLGALVAAALVAVTLGLPLVRLITSLTF